MIEWIGTAASIVGAFLVGFTFFVTGYGFFLIGAISWIVVAYRKRDKALGVLNGFFLVANCIGMYNAI